jgi:hypothetical protein
MSKRKRKSGAPKPGGLKAPKPGGVQAQKPGGGPKKPNNPKD